MRGDLATVESTARAIHDSFIRAQKLTPEQAATLRDRLPPGFVSLDRQFHREAEALAEAAGAGDGGRSAEAYAHMTTRCVGCHRAYARERFPGLAREGSGVRGHEHGHAPHAPPHAHGSGSEGA